ncbi:MAG TPA: nitrilase-related carbon-nitrogen hydrolase [Vicinamibacterales bacterium]|nr:nitrilase-related carbon-nitrogen hydrolase [Vicinamibacterales bacterium]
MGVSLLCVAPVAACAQELMPQAATAWSGFAARPDSAPALQTSAGSPYALEVSGNGVPSVYGGWRTRINGLSGSNHYRFRTRVLATDVPSPRESITILLRWRGAFGDEVAPDYVWKYSVQPDGQLLFDRTVQPPAGTTAVDVELVLQWAPNGRVRFDGLSFAPAPAPAARPVKVVAVSYRPSGTSSGLESVQRAANYGQQVATSHGPDVMVFGELLNVIGAPGTYDAKAETIPGPSTDVMSALARGHSTYVAFGMLEREGRLLYNSAVLIDRSGAIVGKHRKVQLPLAEVSAGITPGNTVRVFHTDFGRVALLICQDVAFPEPAREAAIRGAELLLAPIWGGKPPLTAARAIEQSMWVAASGYDYLSEIVDPLGAVLARVPALNTPDAAMTTIDLARRFREDWSGDWRDVSGKQRRSEPYTADQDPEGGVPPPPPPNNPPTSVISAPTSGTTYVAPATITVSVSAADGDGSVTGVELFANGTSIATDTAAPYAFTWSNVPAGSYALTAKATDNSGAATTSAAVNVTVSNSPPGSLPAPWQTQDIGAVGLTGTASANGGTFTIEGAGADIWSTADAFRYVWQPISGDADIVARVASVENVHAWVKAGVMIRETLTADSRHGLMLVSPGKGLAFQRRTQTGGISTSTSGIAGTAPAWVKLERRAAVISAYYSWDGANWTLVASDTIAMGANVYAGLVVSSHTTSELATATFDSVTVQPVSPPAPVWQSQDIGVVGVAGDASETAGTFTIRGSGADVWGTADAFHFVWQRLSGDRDIIARVATVEYVQPWVKAGVMIREQLTADSAHAFMLVSPGKGLAFQRRVSAGGLSTSTTGGAGTAPAWVKLERRGNVISAYRSADGVTWTFVGNDTFAMGTDVYVGLVVSSHDNTRLATATFDSVTVTGNR